MRLDLFTAPTTSIEAQLPGQQLVRIDVDHDLPILPSEGRRDLRARNDGNLIADRELRVVVQLSFVQAFALHRDQAHRQARRVGLQYDGRQSAGRKALKVCQSQIGKFGYIRIRIGSGLEVNTDDTYSQQGV